MIEALAGKTVYLLYDSEARKDSFGLSPGERYTILNGEKLTGTNLYRQRAHMQAQVAGRKKLGLRDEDIAALEARISKVTIQIEHMRSLAITVRVVRLPRQANVKKVDLDDFLLEQGAARLQSLLDHAPLYSDWYVRHGECSYRYTKGAMWRGDQHVANYQAHVVEDIVSTDGNIETVMHRVALCTPSGTYRTVDIPAEVWADDRKALLAIRTALQTGTAIDTGLETLAAIKQLSLQGDPPIQRIVYRCTG